MKSGLTHCDPAKYHKLVKMQLTTHLFSLTKLKWDNFGILNLSLEGGKMIAFITLDLKIKILDLVSENRWVVKCIFTSL